MSKVYKITLKTKDLFSLPVAIAMKQLDHNPRIGDIFDSDDGQLVHLELVCTRNQMLMMEIALKDYLIGKPKKIVDEEECLIADWLVKGWL